MANTKDIKNSKLTRNKYADDLQYLETDSVTSDKLTSGIEGMLTSLYKSLAKKFTNRSPQKIILNAIKELQNLNFYWIAESVNEKNILTAENVESVQGIAAAHNFQRNRGLSATGRVTLKILSSLVNDSGFSNLTLSNGALLTHTNGLQYFVNLRNESYSIDYSNGATISLNVIQGVKSTATYTGDGNDLQITTISSQLPIATGSIRVISSKVGELTQKGLFRDLTQGDNGYLVRNGFDGDVNIHFSNGLVGYKPDLGEIITIEFIECDGEAGNILQGTDLEFINGVTINGSEYDINSHISLTSDNDFITGYDGDDIEITRLNVGNQSTSNIIATPDHVKSYLRLYPSYSVSDVWREPTTSVINALLTPNINNLTSGNSYFNIPRDSFIVSENDKLLIKTAIFNDQRNQVISNIDFKSYTLANFGMMVFIKLENNLDISENLRNHIIELVSEVLVSSWGENVRQIHKSDIITVLQDSIEEINSIDIKFLAESGNEKYIDEIGDIDTRSTDINNPTYVIPIIQAIEYDGVQLSTPVKVFVEDFINDNTNSTTWVEI